MEFLLSSLLMMAPMKPVPLKSQTVRIAVIDSGYDANDINFKLCNEEYDMTGEGMYDRIKHGYIVNTIIASNLYNLDYCIIPIKFIHTVRKNSEYVLDIKENFYLEALSKAIKVKPDVINISAGGPGSILSSPQEIRLINKALNRGIIIVAAAGNDGKDLDKDCYYYPACISNKIITVGWLDTKDTINKKSNYGSYVKEWRIGRFVHKGRIHYGTSMAAPQVTAEVVKKILLDKNK